MSRPQVWALLGLGLLAALLLITFGVIVSAMNVPLAPLPTELKLVDVLVTAPAPTATLAAPLPGYVHLPPLRLALTPSAEALPVIADATVAAPAPSPQPGLTLQPGSDSYPFALGQSVQGRDIVGYAYPITNSPRGLVLVCGIHGDEVNAWPVLQSIMADLDSDTLIQPPDLSIYFVESLNPDGTAANRRLNAHNIDLNRNWDTYDWRTGVEQSPVDFLPVGGGDFPFSEPETQAMRDFLLLLKATHPGGVTVIYFHAAVPPDGFVSPGTHQVNGQDVADTPSRLLGQDFADLTGYRYANQWIGGYTVTGDASTWAVAQGMVSLTIELPVRDALDAPSAAVLKSGVLQLINGSDN